MRQRRDSKPGFSIIETMIALTVVGVMATTILVIYGRLMFDMQRSIFASHGIFLMHNMIHKMAKEQDAFTPTQESERFPLTTTVEKKAPARTSVFSSVPHVQIITATGSWEVAGRMAEPTLFTLLYQPPQKEEKA